MRSTGVHPTTALNIRWSQGAIVEALLSARPSTGFRDFGWAPGSFEGECDLRNARVHIHAYALTCTSMRARTRAHTSKRP